MLICLLSSANSTKSLFIPPLPVRLFVLLRRSKQVRWQLFFCGFLLELVAAQKSFRSGDTVWAFGPVSLAIAPGESVAVVGRSGAGKSTLLHLLGGLTPPDRGQVRFGGKDLSRLSEAELDRFRNLSLGFVFQDFFLFSEFSLVENVAMPLLIRGLSRPKALEAAAVLLDETGLTGKGQNRPAELSGGQRQRAAIARALIGKPAYILADEPTGNLDSATGREIVQLLTTLLRHKKTALVIVTHDDEVAAAMARRIELADGRITSDSFSS
jgi:ABC-type lipoprotein export system ATPase subunit